jgi:CubicO group peptidase (beta-lactamase class C family)
MDVPAPRTDVTVLDLEAARAVAARHVAAGTLPCIVFGVVDSAGRSASGIINGPRSRVAEDSIFFLASISKGIVATAIMQYVDECRLDPHAPLARYLPEFDGQGREEVSAWHVLTHTSGLPDIAVETLRHERPTYRRSLEYVLASRPAWPPGSRYEYNSAAWLLLSEIMVRLSGLPFPVALRRRLTQPLGMADTGFDPRPQRSRLVAVQGSRFDNRVVQELLLRFLSRAQLPGGGLFGTLPDLLRLGRALLPADSDEPGPRVLSQAIIDEMSRDQTAGLSYVDIEGREHEVRQGLGWRKPQAGWPGSSRSFTHGGISGGRLWIDPDAGFAFAFLANLWYAPLEPAIEILEQVYRGRG